MMATKNESPENPRAEPGELRALKTPAWLRACQNPVVMAEARDRVPRRDIERVLDEHIHGRWHPEPLRRFNLEALRDGGMVATHHLARNGVDIFALTSFTPGIVPLRTKTLVGTQGELERLMRVPMPEGVAALDEGGDK